MSIPRRDFMKSLGISIASILFSGGTQRHEKDDPQAISTRASSFSSPSNSEAATMGPYPTSTALFPQEPTAQVDEISNENPTPTEVFHFNDPELSPRARLRHCWFFLSWLARRYEEGPLIGEWARDLLVSSHRAALVELVVARKMSEVIARDVQKGFDAAVYHVNSSALPVVCYD